MKNLILTAGHVGTFGTIVALLASYMDRQIHDITMARLGDMEVKHKECST